MCVRIFRCSTRITEPWDPRERVITIPAQLDPARALTAVRAVLAELHVEQPESGAVCWCGAPIAGALAIPTQQRPSEVMSRGA